MEAVGIGALAENILQEVRKTRERKAPSGITRPEKSKQTIEARVNAEAQIRGEATDYGCPKGK